MLKAFAYWSSSFSRLETSQHNLILLPGGRVKFRPLFSTEILPFSSEFFLTIL